MWRAACGIDDRLPSTGGDIPHSALRIPHSKWWEVLVTLQSSLPAGFMTPHLQCGSRDTSPGARWLMVHGRGAEAASSSRPVAVSTAINHRPLAMQQGW